MATIDQLGNASTLAYDSEGRVVESRNRNDEVMLYAYDVVGQLVEKTFPDANVASYTYNEAGQITFAANDAALLETAYDPLAAR